MNRYLLPTLTIGLLIGSTLLAGESVPEPGRATKRERLATARRIVDMLDVPLRQCIAELRPEMLDLHRKAGTLDGMISLVDRHQDRVNSGVLRDTLVQRRNQLNEQRVQMLTDGLKPTVLEQTAKRQATQTADQIASDSNES